MEKPIREGDLVIVISQRRCGCLGRYGIPFIARDIRDTGLGGRCFDCGKDLYHGGTVTCQSSYGPIGRVELRRLKRIDPLSELEGQRDASGLDVRQPSPGDFERMVKKMQEAIK